MPAPWADIDWSGPAFEPWAALGAGVVQQVLRGVDLHQALNKRHLGSATADGPRFVPMQTLPPGTNYEAFIDAHNAVPTRNNLHDFFNALCWQRFPRSKRAMNRQYVKEQAALSNPASGRRGRIRDAMTVFDESGAVLRAPDVLWQALVERRWHDAFIVLRPLWREAQFEVFGHAVLEKLVYPFKSITAHVVRLPVQRADSASECDAALAMQMNATWWAEKPWIPVPVLGIPGWCEANHEPAFYADLAVFRPLR